MLATFSLHSVVTDVGAWCGLAALVGLALLVLLYFSQARELRRIADWIEQEEERRRVAPPMPVGRATVVAQGQPPAPAATGAITTAVPGVRRVAVPPTSAVPGPAAVMAPATAAAVAAAAAPEQANGDGSQDAAPRTARARVVAIPVAAPELPAEAFADEPPARPQPDSTAPAPSRLEAVPDEVEPSAPADADPPAREAAEAAEAEAPPDTDVTVSRVPAVPLVAPPIPTAEPAAAESRAVAVSPLDLLRAEPPGVERAEPGHAGEEDDEPAPLEPSTAAGARPRFPPAPPVRVQPLRAEDVTVRAPGRGAPGADATERRRRREPGVDDGPEPPRTMGSTLRLLGAAIVIVAILIVVATQLLGGSSTPTPPANTHSTTTPSNTSGATAVTGVVPGNITVAVLNGTSTSHLAGNAMGILSAKGFVKGATANAPAPAATTSVGYTHAHRRAALAIAADLSLSSTAVRHVGHAAYAVAARNGPPPQVVVILGSDYARH